MCWKTALDPASLSGSGTESSITSARIRTLRSASNSGNSPLKRCVASVSFQRSKNLRWLIAWKRFTPLPVTLVPARAFGVNDFRGRLHDGAVAALPHLEAEIRIFVIKRAVILVELAELAEPARL